jgi:hypothetical protein
VFSQPRGTNKVPPPAVPGDTASLVTPKSREALLWGEAAALSDAAGRSLRVPLLSAISDFRLTRPPHHPADGSRPATAPPTPTGSPALAGFQLNKEPVFMNSVTLAAQLDRVVQEQLPIRSPLGVNSTGPFEQFYRDLANTIGDR